MDEEIEIYLEYIKDMKKIQWNEFVFYQGKFRKKDIILVKSGVGKVFATMVTQVLIDRFNVGFIIFTGVGGSLNADLNIGDVVISKDSMQHDFDATALGFKLGQISYTDYRIFKADKRLIEIASKAKIKGHKIIKGRILTGDQFFTHREKLEKRFLRDELHGDCIEMEGAAVGQVCTVNKIPHLIVRTVSDKADGTAVEDFNAFKEIVAKNSYKIVKQLLENIE